MSKTKLQEKNFYTIGFALVMSLIVAGGLAGLKQVWGPKQTANELLFAKGQILNSVMDVERGMDIDSIFDKTVTGKLIDNNGNVISEDINKALSLSLYKESKVPADKRRFPVYTYSDDSGSEKYIVPTVGKGLWDQIMAFVALEDDKKTIAGITFDHIGETPGLGAKIKDDPNFYTDFIGEKIFDADGTLVGVLVRKGNNDPLNKNKDDHTIDAISGATITGDGVEDMLQNELKHYLPFLKENNQ